MIFEIQRYLPYPAELPAKDPVISSYGNELCSFVFKTLHDKQLGALTFMRVFSGSLKPSQKIYNASREKQEKILKVYQPLADDLNEIQEVIPGQVAVVSGLKVKHLCIHPLKAKEDFGSHGNGALSQETFTGDTVTSSSSVASSARRKLAKLFSEEEIRPVLTSVEVPEPVFFCSVEPASLVIFSSIHVKASNKIQC